MCYFIVFGGPAFCSNSDTILIRFEDEADLPIVGVFVFEVDVGSFWIEFF